MSKNRIKELQEKLNQNMDKVVKLAEKDTIRNENGEVVCKFDVVNKKTERRN